MTASKCLNDSTARDWRSITLAARKSSTIFPAQHPKLFCIAQHARAKEKLEPELQSACWRLASRITPHPTHHVVAKIVGAVNGSKVPVKLPTSEKKRFLAALHRLALTPGFSAYLLAQELDEAKARKHLAAAQQLMSRLHELIGTIKVQFQQL